MDIDDYYPRSSTVEESYDMMIDDDFVPNAQKEVTVKKALGGVGDSIWANAPSQPPSFRRPRYEEAPAYLDNDPTLVAPSRPFRPEHTSYSWAVR